MKSMDSSSDDELLRLSKEAIEYITFETLSEPQNERQIKVLEPKMKRELR
jgi:hypothetical protein